MNPLLLIGGALGIAALSKKKNTTVSPGTTPGTTPGTNAAVNALPVAKQSDGNWFMNEINAYLRQRLLFQSLIVGTSPTSGKYLIDFGRFYPFYTGNLGTWYQVLPTDISNLIQGRVIQSNSGYPTVNEMPTLDEAAKAIVNDVNLLSDAIAYEKQSSWSLTSVDEYNIALSIVSLIKITPQNNVAGTHVAIQDRINDFMSDSVSLHNLDYIKIGGASGVMANTKTAKAFIFAWATTHPLMPALDSYTGYTYPGLSAHVNDSASDGLGRGKAPGGTILGISVNDIIKAAPAIIALL